MNGNTATFDPTSSLAASTSYTATITTGVKDTAGNAMTSAKTWSFTTASGADTTPPTVTSTNPSSGATGVAVTSSVTGTFSEAVQSSTVSTTTFTLKAGTTSIPGTVTMNGNTATFDPTSSLAASTSYTATITTGVKDTAGNAMTSAKTWSFTTAAAPPPPPPPSSCNDNLAISTATSTPTQNSFPATNAIDNNANTKWWSTFSVNPAITVDLGTSKTVCSVVISWADGNQRTYTFRVEVSTGGSFTPVLTTTSKGTTSPETYSFTDSSARFVKIVITQSHAGSSNSMGQISEIDVLGKATSVASTLSSSESTRLSTSSVESESGTPEEASSSATQNNEEAQDSESSPSANRAPVARNDVARTESNHPVLVKILNNDNDPDRDILEITSVASPEIGGSVKVNENGTITFSPATDFVGIDTFSYDISDGKGKSDNGKVTVIVKELVDDDDKPKQTDLNTEDTKDQQPIREDNTSLEPEIQNEPNIQLNNND